LHNNYFLKHAAKIIKKYQLYNDINKKYPEKYFFSTILIRYKSMLLNFGLNCCKIDLLQLFFKNYL